MRLAIVSTYPPRRCGIAEYTSDLWAALRVVAPDLLVDIVAVDWDGLPYADEVVAVVEPGHRESYSSAIDVLAGRGVDAVLIQHEYGREYGISGDTERHGTNLVALAHAATAHRIPYAVTLHTVPFSSTDVHHELLRAMCANAALVTVFTQRAWHLVDGLDIVPSDRLVVIPHGAPPNLLTAPEPSPYPELAGVGPDDPILTTFGLIGSTKGLHIAIDAVALLTARHPTLRYVIAGQTHPEIIRRYGEAYRSQLIEQVRLHELDRHVHFIDRYLSIEEIGGLLRQSTVVITPYQSADQTSSGVLTFALACGRPVVSTAYQFAEEILATGAGRLVARNDPHAMACALDGLLSDGAALRHCSTIAQQIGSQLAWPTIARRLLSALLPQDFDGRDDRI